MLLAVATNLPEVAITASAALRGNLRMAIGNILGRIAIQTGVLVKLDVVGVGRSAPLTYRAASLVLVLEGRHSRAHCGHHGQSSAGYADREANCARRFADHRAVGGWRVAGG